MSLCTYNNLRKFKKITIRDKKRLFNEKAIKSGETEPNDAESENNLNRINRSTLRICSLTFNRILNLSNIIYRIFSIIH